MMVQSARVDEDPTTAAPDAATTDAAAPGVFVFPN